MALQPRTMAPRGSLEARRSARPGRQRRMVATINRPDLARVRGRHRVKATLTGPDLRACCLITGKAAEAKGLGVDANHHPQKTLKGVGLQPIRERDNRARKKLSHSSGSAGGGLRPQSVSAPSVGLPAAP